jgi:polyisoprenoid-binding protein YceI
MHEGLSPINMKNFILFLLAARPILGAPLPGQNDYNLAKGYKIAIHGTMSIHDWVETVGEVTGELTAGRLDGGGEDFTAVRITMIVRSIKSDMGKTMDNKTYKALKADADPQITFLLGAPVTILPARLKQGSVALAGQLTMAGVTRAATLLVTRCTLTPDSMLLEGVENIKMTDFGIKPPSALFGTLKASADITISFKTTFIIQRK